MEEDKLIRRKRIFRFISKSIVYSIIIFMMTIASLLVLLFVTTKIAESNNEYPPYGLYNIISPSMVPSINVYDVILIKNVETNTLKEGDVITFYSINPMFGTTPITHRIVEIINDGSVLSFKVKGDANEVIDNEIVLSKNILGKVILKINGLGKIQYFIASKKGWFIAIVTPIVLIISYDIYKLIRLLMLRKKLKELSIDSDLPSLNE